MEALVSIAIWTTGFATGCLITYGLHLVWCRLGCSNCREAGRPVHCEEHEGRHPYDPARCVGPVADGWEPSP